MESPQATMEALMVRLAACLVGTYFVAFAATSLVVARPDAPANANATTIIEKQEPRQAVAKADLLRPAGEASEKRRVAEVELFGGEDLMVILRDGEGREVYRIDHASNMTIAARDVLLPQLRLHAQMSEERVEERVREDVEREQPRPPARSRDGGVEEEAGEEQIFACESGLSSLADLKAASLPRVCLVGSLHDAAEYAAIFRK
jgi:hypothetical protein